MDNNFKVWLDTEDELEKINKELEIGWRGIIGLAKFDDKKENLYINKTASRYERPKNLTKEFDIFLIEMLIRTERHAEMSEELRKQLKEELY